MNRMDQLYQDMILDHNKNPRNYGDIKGHTHKAKGINPICGDNYELFITMKADIIENIGFKGSGCAISKSSASMMTSLLKGKTREEALELKECFINLVTKGCDGQCDTCLGKLKVFEGVKKYPIRIKCATLIWRALESALNQNSSMNKETKT
ncbi:Fe-S cluster assembly sulfur transfer protein SufU [Thermoproteota archaeon]